MTLFDGGGQEISLARVIIAIVLARPMAIRLLRSLGEQSLKRLLTADIVVEGYEYGIDGCELEEALVRGG
jgi:hypothetical protein